MLSLRNIFADKEICRFKPVEHQQLRARQRRFRVTPGYLRSSHKKNVKSLILALPWPPSGFHFPRALVPYYHCSTVRRRGEKIFFLLPDFVRFLLGFLPPHYRYKHLPQEYEECCRLPRVAKTQRLDWKDNEQLSKRTKRATVQIRTRR